MRDGAWPRDWGICAVSVLWLLACRGGGVPVAFKVTQALGAPLNVIVVRGLMRITTTRRAR
jgi:predicted phosphoribosyltransferase